VSRRPALILAVSGGVILALLIDRVWQRHGWPHVWSDAHAAVTWDNPLCSTFQAIGGFDKARRIHRRSDEIQAASQMVREEDGLYLYDTPLGSWWLSQKDDLFSIATLLAEQEQDIYGRPGGLGVRSGDVVVDAGAHVGLFTRTALRAGASRVITFEVTPDSNRALRRNLAAEIAAGKVTVIEKGVWFEESTLPLVIVDRCSACNSVSHPWLPATVEVPLTTIDRAVEELDLERVDFIKLDIENAEANALRGARRTLVEYQPRVAVALENSKTRIAYAHEVLGVMQDAFAGYRYACGVCTTPEPSRRVLPEVLHFYTE
jgi:FkbM family methyltransferase